MAKTILVTHQSGLAHEMGAGHPERPERLRAIEKRLSAERFGALARVEAPMAEREALLRVHPESYIDAIEQASPRTGRVALDADTVMNPHTLDAALHAAGGAVEAVNEVMGGKADMGFVAMRPPGHHAGSQSAMGFCVFNNVAVAARHALAAHGAERVAIVDFDVHHGNGTQEIFWAERNVLFCSTHQSPFYPGTGAACETGEHDSIVNAPLWAGSGGDAFMEAFKQAILPRVNSFSPDIILLSAGFDAHADDPLGGLRLSERDFSEATKRLVDIAVRRCNARVVSLLEGGYDLEALARSVEAHVEALMGA